ncbi:MAG: methyltransferase domain-containing protein [Jatrophihabitans sp.]|uniref:methyltransferase domain-containing protein n=1 Tax=Jatrophihabitans sp. TaxID=1932789 RepID=UPI003F804B6F
MRVEAVERRAGRQGVIWQTLARALPSITDPSRAVRVLDCGGGSGTYAVPLATDGADVTVVDTSVDALATLQRRADEAGVAASVHPVQGDVEALPDAVAGDRYDLVLAHGILEAVDDVAGAFAAMAGLVRAGGLLSVVVDNPVAAVLGRALAGEPAAALAELRGLTTDLGHPGGDAVRVLCREAGLTVESRHGVGVFTEWVPGAALDAPGARETLAELEAEAADRPPFVDIAARIHVLARRPA